MVWNTTQSSLYRAVSDYNKSLDNDCCQNTQCSKESCKQECCNKCCDNYADKRCENNTHVNNCRNDCACKCNKPHNSQNNLSLDTDFLLLAGLIYILYKEGADKKLIIALAVALLG